MGSGCAIHDLDGDNRPDLVLLTNGGPDSKSTNQLLRQKPDGTFEDVSAGSGLDFSGWTMGIAIGDVDNDGLPDVLITQVGRTRLLLNLGNMKFRDISEEAGIKNPLFGTSAAFLDYDRDGRLDLFVVNYFDYDRTWTCRSVGGELDYCNPKTFPGTSSKLFATWVPRAASAWPSTMSRPHRESGTSWGQGSASPWPTSMAMVGPTCSLRTTASRTGSG